MLAIVDIHGRSFFTLPCQHKPRFGLQNDDIDALMPMGMLSLFSLMNIRGDDEREITCRTVASFHIRLSSLLCRCRIYADAFSSYSLLSRESHASPREHTISPRAKAALKFSLITRAPPTPRTTGDTSPAVAESAAMWKMRGGAMLDIFSLTRYLLMMPPLRQEHSAIAAISPH